MNDIAVTKRHLGRVQDKPDFLLLSRDIYHKCGVKRREYNLLAVAEARILNGRCSFLPPFLLRTSPTINFTERPKAAAMAYIWLLVFGSALL